MIDEREEGVPLTIHLRERVAQRIITSLICSTYSQSVPRIGEAIQLKGLIPRTYRVADVVHVIGEHVQIHVDKPC